MTKKTTPPARPSTLVMADGWRRNQISRYRASAILLPNTLAGQNQVYRLHTSPGGCCPRYVMNVRDWAGGYGAVMNGPDWQATSAKGGITSGIVTRSLLRTISKSFSSL